MKKTIAVIVTIFVIFVGLTIVLSLNSPFSGGNDLYSGIVDNDFEIVEALYDIDVSEDRSARVEEHITVRFLRDNKRGIIRDLPTNSGEQYYDITLEGDEDEYYVKPEDDFISIYTGNDYIAKYDHGEQVTYIFKYIVVPPVRTVGNTNYYMNIVPFGWATSQSNVTVDMKFPYDINDIEIFKGRYGTTDIISSDLYSVSGNELTMKIDKLIPFNGVTVDVELGRKFNGNFSLPGILAILVSIIVIGVAICIKLLVLKDRRIFPVLNANPPFDNGAEIDPAEMGYLIDRNCEAKDITALIFYFASKGLLKIEKDGFDEFTLIKTGELDTLSHHQRTIFNGLFATGDKVTISQLKNRFYDKIAGASAEIKNKYAGKIVEGSSKAGAITTAVVCTIALFALMVCMMIRINPTYVIRGGLFALVFFAIAVVIGFVFGRDTFNIKHKKSQNKLLIRCSIAAIVAMAVSFFAALFLLNGVFPFYGVVILVAAHILLGFVCGLIERKTEYYASLMNEITGFKQFIETAEKEKLEAMLEEDPQYYYNILPYANVLGVSDKWENKFEELESVPPPTYYYGGPDIFDFMLFNSMFRSSFTSFTSAMISRPSSSSYSGGGGHFGGFGGFGGGFGGGGFGGGGGRSR